jgi:peptide deformylase
LLGGKIVALLDVVVWPAKVLETKAEPVVNFDDDLRQFVSDMFETMHASGGIGLAANQVGDLRRVIVIEIPAVPDEAVQPWHNKRWVLINPVIKKKSGKIRWQEGCLSFPEVFDFVDRAAEVWVEAFDEFGKPFEVHATELFSVCIQHEIDHIDGIVFFQRMSRLKADIIKKKMIRRGPVNV